MNETDILAGHFRDLAERSYNQNLYTFTSFLSEAELAVLMEQKKELSYAGITVYGGTEWSERCMVRFGREEDLDYVQDFPIICLQIAPLAARFSDPLSHRDFLGALMSLGIERELLGDLYAKENCAYLFCAEHIAPYLMESLTQVRHTGVSVRQINALPEDVGPCFREVTIIAPSERLDAVIAKVFHLSRSQSQGLFRERKIFINGKLCENSSIICKDGDRISVRGFGKFIYSPPDGITGKGRYRITVQVFA